MKYIRTKDGIFERMFPNKEHQISFDYKTIEPAYYIVKHDWVAKKDVIKQADTIEELCDEFRGIWKNYWESKNEDAHEEYHYNKEENVFYDDWEKLTHKEAVEKFDIFYGAIWTDKGLIYKAKLNKAGKLELL